MRKRLHRALRSQHVRLQTHLRPPHQRENCLLLSASDTLLDGPFAETEAEFCSWIVGFVAGGAIDLEELAASAIGGGGDIGDRRQRPTAHSEQDNGHKQDRAKQGMGNLDSEWSVETAASSEERS